MTLKYSKTLHSGTTVPGCGAIHISEVNATLTKLSEELELPFNLNNFVIGSAGKTEYAGDIDVVIDKEWYDRSIEEFHRDLKSLFNTEDIVRHGPMIHLRYPINDFDKQYIKRLPRTGFVQVDFVFGDAAWKRFFHYSHGTKSAYKGFHRNIAISAVTYASTVVFNNAVDDYGRYISVEKWKWGTNGLFRVVRNSRRRANGAPGWVKMQTDDISEGPYKDEEFIARTIFPVDGTPDDLNSLENVMAAIKRNYALSMQETIYKQMAKKFNENNDALHFSYPPEIEKYFKS